MLSSHHLIYVSEKQTSTSQRNVSGICRKDKVIIGPFDEHNQGQSGLEISVMDHYNGTEREVGSLSGGEKFLASLSLALGLSDEIQNSAGGIQVDTLFVDEGFGSLDSEKLDLVYRALTSLTEGHRMVGIISHVQELEDKIDHQIVVTKQKTGGSKTEIIV